MAFVWVAVTDITGTDRPDGAAFDVVAAYVVPEAVSSGGVWGAGIWVDDDAAADAVPGADDAASSSGIAYSKWTPHDGQ